jgi:uncharacterized membrane protein YcaP (DUF421 family)
MIIIVAVLIVNGVIIDGIGSIKIIKTIIVFVVVVLVVVTMSYLNYKPGDRMFSGQANMYRGKARRHMLQNDVKHSKATLMR